MAQVVKKSSKRRERGQGMTEYIIIVALIAIGTIAVVTIFGDNIRALFGSSANALAGQSGTLEGKAVEDRETLEKTLKNFNDEAP